jgi:hypothetical protein
MAKLQEERIVAGIDKNKSKSIYRFKSIFLQCKRIKKTCQEKNDYYVKKIFSHWPAALEKEFLWHPRRLNIAVSSFQSIDEVIRGPEMLPKILPDHPTSAGNLDYDPGIQAD